MQRSAGRASILSVHRSPIYKCPNHLECLTGYHGDDVEIAPETPLLCPECGTPLVRLRSPRRGLPVWLVNLLTVAALVFALFIALPHVKRLWDKVTTPVVPARKR